jgi:transposase
MEVLYARCAGLDVHKKKVVACVLVTPERGAPSKTVRTFGTLADEVLALGDWLAEQGVTHVALESTGIYWQPLWNLLEDRFTLLLVNAQHVHQVPGRKTDVRDCEWLADLLRHGLLRASFVPERPQRELRELVRYRTSLVRERGRAINRLQKTLEGANLKLTSVASNVVGRASLAILTTLVAGETDPTVLAAQAGDRLRASPAELERALDGRVGPHQRFLVGEHLQRIAELDAAIERLSAEAARRLAAEQPALERLDGIPGVARRTAEIVLAEVGADLARFPSPAHLASWAGLCPGNNESGGKQLAGRTRKGNPWLRSALVEAAHAAVRTKGSYFGVQFRRIASRRGAKRALIAVAHTLLTIIYYLLTRGCAYADLGTTFFDQQDRRRTERRLVSRLQQLGYRVSLQPLASTA